MPEPLSYRQLEPCDSKLLVQGIERVYGDTYPVPDFYDQGYIAGAIKQQRLHSVVALNSASEVVGCMSTVLEQVGDYTADGSALMVAPEYRGHGIVAQLGHYSVEIYRRLGLGGLHLYALALHDLVQNQSGRAGAVVTGILPAWFSKRATVAGYDYPDARIGAVTLYMPLAGLPARSCYLPARHATVLGQIYARLDIPRSLLEPPAIPLPDSAAFRTEHKPANQQVRATCLRIGADFEMALQNIFPRDNGRAVEVEYLDLPLQDPGIGEAVDTASEQGFFFGALMVDRCGCDHLRLQRFPADLAAPASMVLATPEARSLLDYLLADAPFR